MTKVMCGYTECANNRRGRCQLDFVSLRPVTVHTLYDGWRHAWKCDLFQISEEHMEKLNAIGGNVRGSRQKEDYEMI